MSGIKILLDMAQKLKLLNIIDAYNFDISTNNYQILNQVEQLGLLELYYYPKIATPKYPDLEALKKILISLSTDFKLEPDIKYIPTFLNKEEQNTLISHLKHLDFVSSKHLIFGKPVTSSTQYMWISDTGLDYYFGKTMLESLKARKYDEFPLIKRIKEKVEKLTGKKFNSVLVNKYNDGSTSLSYHHDNDPWLGDNFIVPSLSLGAKRKFLVKSKNKPTPKFTYILESGSLVIMGELVQKYWLHSIPKQINDLDNPKKKTGIRYNLTFRNIIPELVYKMPKGPKKPK